jgi:CBS domain-containing protein
MQEPPIPLATAARMTDVATRLADEGRGALPVVDVDERVIGVVDARTIERALDRGEDGVALVLAEGSPALHPEDELGKAIEAITEGDREGLPITSASGRLVGWVEHRDLLRAYAKKGRRTGDRRSGGVASQAGS